MSHIEPFLFRTIDEHGLEIVNMKVEWDIRMLYINMELKKEV